MAIRDDVHSLMPDYPRLYFASHTRPERDPRTKETLSAAQASILDHLDDVEGTPVTLLAEHLGVTVSTMSLNLDRLEAKKYVRRRRDPADGRRMMVRLTAAGLRIREAISVLDADLVRGLLRQLPRAQRDEALNGLRLLANAASESIRKRPDSTWKTMPRPRSG